MMTQEGGRRIWSWCLSNQQKTGNADDELTETPMYEHNVIEHLKKSALVTL